MGVLVKGQHGLVHSDVRELAHKIRMGDGVNWAGDVRLDLIMRVIEERDTNGRTVRTGRRYEVWRQCEDGETRFIGAWLLEQKDQIILDLAVMRARVDRPSDFDSVEQTIDDHNAKVEQDQQDRYVEANWDQAEHLARLWHDVTQPVNRFRQVGKALDDAGR